MQWTTAWLCTNHWVSLTHVLHKKNPFDLFLTINESLALKGLLVGSICFLRQSIAQTLWGGQVVWGVRKKNPLSSLTIRDSLCCKAKSYHLRLPFARYWGWGRVWGGRVGMGVHGCPNQIQLATGSRQVRILRKLSRDLWIWKENNCKKWACTRPPFNSRPTGLCPAVPLMWLWFQFLTSVCKMPVTFCCRLVQVVLGVPKILESSPYLPSPSLDTAFVLFLPPTPFCVSSKTQKPFV